MNTESSVADTLNFALFVKNFSGGAVTTSGPVVTNVTRAAPVLTPTASQSFSSTSSANPVSTQTATSSTSVKSSSNKILRYAFYVLIIYLAYSYFTSASFKKTRLSRSISRSISRIRSRLSSSRQSKSKSVEKEKVVEKAVEKAKDKISSSRASSSKEIKSAESAEYQQIVNKYLQKYQ
jgi:hypothetical protein